MHLSQIDAAHMGMICYLEAPGGARSFEAAPDMPRDVAHALRAQTERDRLLVEHAWAKFMISKGWVHVHADRGHIIVIAYPGMSQEFARVVPVRGNLDLDDITLDAAHAKVVLGPYRPRPEQIRLPLAGWLWR